VRGETVKFTVRDNEGTPVDATVQLSGTDSEKRTGSDGNTTITVDTLGTLNAIATKDTTDGIDYAADSVQLTVESPTLGVSESQLTFETVSLGQSETREIILENNISTAIDVESVSVTGPDAEAFQIVTTVPDEIPANSKQTVSLNFSPTDRGEALGEFEINNKRVGLDGTGRAPRINITSAETEITANADAPTNGTLNITNDGNTALNASLSLTDPVFQLYPNRTVIGPDESSVVLIEYAPTDDYQRGNTSTLRIAHKNDSVSPVELTLKGIVKTRELRLGQSTVEFGNTTVGKPTNRSVVVTNSGTTTETVEAAVNDTTNFSLIPEDRGSVTLAPGEYERLTVTANVTDEGPLSASLTVANTTDDSLETTATLTATGRSPTLNTTNGLSFSDTSVNSTATKNLEIRNDGNTKLTVSLDEALNNSERRHFSIISPKFIEVPAGGQRTVTLGFSPQSCLSTCRKLTLASPHKPIEVGSHVPKEYLFR
jgi:hypothetical protein